MGWLRLAMVAAVASAVWAQDLPLPEEKDWRVVCGKATATPLPLASYTHDEAWLRACNAEALYYGYGHKPDYAAARECAFYQRDHADPTRGDPFAGPGVLAMIYANGDGVARDYDLSIHFACENTWAADAEMAYRIGHLEQLKAQGPDAKRFDLCNDATSGLMMGACESVTQSFGDNKRAQALQSFVAAQHWNATTQRQFQAVHNAEKAFEEARVRFEVDLSGTARAMFELEEQGRLHDQFLINLQRFAKGDVPETTADDAAGLHQQVQTALAKIHTLPASTWQYGTVKPEGIDKTQALYDRLENAWLKFAPSAFPQLTASQVRAQLNLLRLHQLQSEGGQ